MSAEERWAQNKEWAEEKRMGFDVEVKVTHDVTGKNLSCDVPECKNKAVRCWKIGVTGNSYCTDICLCSEHDDDETAFKIYDDVSEPDGD